MAQWTTDELESSGMDAGLAAPMLEALALNSFESITITAADKTGPAGNWFIVFVNSAFEEMTGYEKDEVVGQSPKILQGPKTDDEVLSRLDRDVSEGRTFHGETVNYRKDGSEFVIEWKVIPVRDDKGEVAQYLAIQHDVTAQRQG